jgi:hypothetical protein
MGPRTRTGGADETTTELRKPQSSSRPPLKSCPTSPRCTSQSTRTRTRTRTTKRRKTETSQRESSPEEGREISTERAALFVSFSFSLLPLSSGETNPRIGIQRFESFCQFCGRARRFEFPSQGFESLLPSKKYPKLLTIVQVWVTFSKHLQIYNLF